MKAIISCIRRNGQKRPCLCRQVNQEMRDCHLWWDGLLLERGRQYLPTSFLARTSIQGHPPGGYGSAFQPFCPSCPMHGVGIVATHGGSSAFSSLISLMSHTDPLFHPYPWTIAVPGLTDSCFWWIKGILCCWHVKPLPNGTVSAPVYHVGLLTVSQTVCFPCPNPLFPPVSAWRTLLPPLPCHLVFMVQPGCLSVLGKSYPSYPPP